MLSQFRNVLVSLASRKGHFCLELVFVVGIIFSSYPAHAVANSFAHLRAVHFGGNWGGNISGIKTSVSSLITSAKSISVDSAQTNVSRSSFVNSRGETITSDVAVVKLTGVRIGSGTPLPQAGFWLGRDANTNQVFLQFRPSLDVSLTNISGFSSDITITFSADGTPIDTSQIALTNGVANDYVLSIMANGSSLIQQGSFSLLPPASFDRTAIASIFQLLTSKIQSKQEEYWNSLKSKNVEWIGISVAIFSGPLADPSVRTKYRPTATTDFGIYTFDDKDLEQFISRAKLRGFKVFLTLAFEPSNVNLPPSQVDPTCNTNQFTPNRAWFGHPTPNTGDPNQLCINSNFWWWNPAHSSHASSMAEFWGTYTQIAVKYAMMSQALGVDMFSLGTETDMLFRTRPSTTWNNHFLSQLQQMVSAVRSVYTGMLTYDQQYYALSKPEWLDGGNGSKYLFGDLALDVIGISAYFPLSSSTPIAPLPLIELETKWESVFSDYLIPLQAANPSKPIVFLEFGYTDDLASVVATASSEGLSYVASDKDGNGIDDGRDQQKNTYQAFFNVNARHNDLVRGAFLWGNGIPNGSFELTSRGFSIDGKPATGVVQAIYGAWRQSDCIFNWAEISYAPYFSPPSGTAVSAPYTYRYYANTGSYLATSSDNNHVWALVPSVNNTPVDVGAVADLLGTAGCQ